MTTSRRGTVAAFAAVTTLFFAWGFITSLIDPLVAAVKGIFDLTDVQAQLSASAFFIAYGLISMPAAVLVSRRRSVPSILIALGTMIAGCLVMLVAANLAVYTLVLLGLFILASGITILQVAANPLAAALGDPKYSHFRLTLSQTFNSVGTFIGPYLGAVLFLEGLEVKEGEVVTQAVRDNALIGIDFAYFWLCGLIAMLLVFFVLARKTVEAAAPAPSATASSEVTALLRKIVRSPIALLGSAGLIAALAAGSSGVLNSSATLVISIVSLLAVLVSMGLATASRWALFGGLAIFLYVGAEVAIGTQMAFFLNSNGIWGASDAPAQIGWLARFMQLDSTPGVSLQEAGKAVSLYWGGAMVGRFVGSALLARFNAAWLLAIFTGIATILCLYVFAIGGVAAGFVALSIGLFNSIMFPTIFTLTLERSTASQESTSGFLCTAIVGGAAIPPLVGAVSQSAGYVTAFVVPMLCYVALCVFAIAATRAAIVARDEPTAATIH